MQNVTHVRIVLDVVAVLQTYKSKKHFQLTFRLSLSFFWIISINWTQRTIMNDFITLMMLVAIGKK